MADEGPIAGEVMLAEKTGVEENVHLAFGNGDFVVTAPGGIAFELFAMN